MKMNHIWIPIWIFIFLIGFKINCMDVLGNKGIEIIQKEYYRFFSGLLVHVNIIHLLINSISIYFVVNFLYEQVNSLKLLLFSAVVGIIANAIFSILYRSSISIGGSPIIFAMLGLIFILQIVNKDIERFTLDTLQTRWILGYAILGNVPLFSGNISTLVIHFISFIVAVVLGYIGVVLKIF